MAIETTSQIKDIELGVGTGKDNNSAEKDENMYLKNAPSTFMNWMVNMKDNVKNDTTPLEEILWKRFSIYKVPAFAREINPKNFTPQLVSFGPYHHGKGELALMEVHKERALFHFLKRAKLELDKVVRKVERVVEELMYSYELLDNKWIDDKYGFLKLMITDGCFMLELLQFTTAEERGYPPTDPFFSEHGIRHTKPYIRRDMLMIENQLPLLLLKKLVVVEKQYCVDDKIMHELLLRFVGKSANGLDSPSLHLLHLYRMSLLNKTSSQVASSDKKTSSKDLFPITTIRNAMSLHEAGVTFKKSKSQSLHDIHFDEKKGVLQLPRLVVDDSTECTLLNIIAFEHLHTNVDHDVSSYVSFMDEIIDSASDVSLLSKKEILQNSLGSDKALAGLFNEICKEVTTDPYSALMEVRQQVQKYCGKSYNTWRANLSHNYFYSPWSVIKLLGALLVIALTIIQTGYSIAPFYKSDSDLPPLPPPPPPAARSH